MPRVKNTRGVRTAKKLKGLHPLLTTWAQVVQDYCHSDNYDDNPWWYNERASLSTLAGAAWRLPGWYALEEFSTTKRGVVAGRRVEDRQVVLGRCDLYVSHASTNFAFEAKQVWQSIGSRASKNHVPGALARAVRDAGNLTADQADHRLGVVFVAPFIPLSEVSEVGLRGRRTVDPQRVRASFDAWIQGLDMGTFDAYAYSFIGRCENFIGEGQIARVFPGVLAAFRRCRTGTKRARSR